MVKLLLSVRIRSFFASLSGRRKDGSLKVSRGKIIGLSVLFGIIGLTIVGMIAMYALAACMALLPLGLDAAYFGTFMAVDFGIVFFLSVLEMKTHLFECKDNELLLSMPIKPSAIVLSRILMVSILNFIESFLIMLPATIIYGAIGGSWQGVVGGIVAAILIPMLVASISSVVGWLFALVARKMKRMTFVKVVISMAALIVFYKFYFEFFLSDSVSDETIVAALDNPALRLIGSPAILDPIPLIIFVVVSLGSAALALYLISKSYVSIVTAKVAQKQIKYEGNNSESRSAFTALVIKEIKRFTSSSSYILNSTGGILMVLLLGLGYMVYGDTINGVIEGMSGMLGGINVLPLCIAGMGVFSFGMSTTSAAALSIEGQSLWILKTMPISARSVLVSKTVPHILVNSPFAIAFGIVAGVYMGIGTVDTILVTLIFLLSAIAAGFMGIILNTAFPKFKFDNIAKPVKQSTPVVLMMVYATITAALMVGVGMALFVFMSSSVALAVLAVLSLVFCCAELAIICLPCARKYESFTA